MHSDMLIFDILCGNRLLNYRLQIEILILIDQIIHLISNLTEVKNTYVINVDAG